MLPQVLKNNIVHLRQGLAISIFLIGYFSKNRFISPCFLLMSIFIHSSFIFIVFFYYLNIIFLHLRLAADVRATLVLIFGVFISILGLSIAGMLGARQGVNAEYTSFGGRDIGFGFLFWLSILLLYFSAGKQFLKEQSLSIIILLFYMSTFLFFPVTARIFESGLILVLLTGLHLNGKNLLIFLSAFFIYFILQWASRLGTPYYGWA
jgi:hypothetical protein